VGEEGGAERAFESVKTCPVVDEVILRDAHQDFTQNRLGVFSRRVAMHEQKFNKRGSYGI
jgi:hypothetical protein